MTNSDRMKKTRKVNNLGLSRPRSERPYYDKSSCISVGVESSGGSGSKEMQFSRKRPEDLWGKK